MPRKRLRGLVFTALSSRDGITSVASLGSHMDIKHWIIVENLGGYPLDLTCTGRITSTHPSVEFSSPQTGVMPSQWSDSYPGLPDRQKKDFSHVALRPHGSSLGTAETIYADLDAFWPQSARPARTSVNLQVKP